MPTENALNQPPRLLDHLRERSRYRHFSLRTEQAYVHWVRAFIRYHQLRHPREMGAVEVEQFLAWLATERKVAPSTHTQALSALLFLYREVLGVGLPWLNEIGRPKQRERVPVVLSRVEVARLLSVMDGVEADLASLLYGTGMRLMEALQLRVKDIDFDRNEITVRQGKGGKDRRMMLPQRLAPSLRQRLEQARIVWSEDREADLPGVWMPDTLEPKYPRAAESWPVVWCPRWTRFEAPTQRRRSRSRRVTARAPATSARHPHSCRCAWPSLPPGHRRFC